MNNKGFIAIMIISAMVVLVKNSSHAATAEENYRFYCTQCHGVSGNGDGINVTKEMPVTPRDHASAEEMSKLTDSEIISAIADGGAANSKSPLMPPFGKTMTRDEIKDMMLYLRKMCKCKSVE